MKNVDILTTLLIILLIPMINLAFTTIYIPNALSVGDFAEWRLASAIIAFAGILHLGTADGLYKFWLANRKNTIELETTTLFFILLLTVVLSLSASFLVFRFLGLDLNSSESLFVCILLVCLSSFSSYYSQVFLNGNMLRISLSSQSLLFLTAVLIAGALNIESVPLIIASYGFATLPSILLMIMSKKVILKKNSSLREIQQIFLLGLPLIFINVLIILFVNLDKLYARLVLGGKTEFAEYAIRSSLFVAACSLGMTVGSLLVSKRIHILYSKWRFIATCFALFLAFLSSTGISTLLNIIIKKYSVDYAPFFLVSVLAFVFFAIYVSYGRIHMASFSQKVLIFFPFYYFAVIWIETHFYTLNFVDSSTLAIATFILLSIFLFENHIYREKHG